MDKEIRAEIDKAKANLDRLGDALDRVATDPGLREKLAALPIETLTELGFDFDDETRKEILEALADETKAMEEWIGIWSASAVKSGVKSGVKVGVATAVKSGVKSGVKTGVETITKAEPGGAPHPPKQAGSKAAAKTKAAPKKGGGKKKE